jgi:hypothetical protein
LNYMSLFYFFKEQMSLMFVTLIEEVFPDRV